MNRYSRTLLALLPCLVASVLLAQGETTSPSPTSPQPGPPSYVVWGLFIAWLVTVVLVLRRRWPRFFTSGSAVSDGEVDSAWFANVSPIVRLRRNASWFPLPLTRRDEVIILYPGQLVRIRLRRNTAIPGAYRPDGFEELKKTKGVKVLFSFPLESIEKIVFKKPWLRGFFLNLVRMTVYSSKKKRRMYVRGSELPNLLRALEFLLPERVTPPKQARRDSPKKRNAGDLSQHRPMRSRPLALVLKVLSAVLIVVAIWSSFKQPALAVSALVYLVVVGMLQIANGLWEKDPAKLIGSDTRPPVLYLRSFLDDRETSLHPETAFSALVGLDPPYYSLEQYRDAAFYKFARWTVGFLSNHHPIRMIKLLIGRPLDSSEEQMSGFFAKFGMFVAIGKPGEEVATTGAARMYVGNDQWQRLVIDLLAKSQIVLLQPSSTQGVWWEVQKTIELAAPTRTLMCMVDYRDRQNDYEVFRLRLEKLLPSGAQVPRAVGNNPSITFLYFDETWNAHELRLCYYSRLLWRIKFRAVDLQRTLQPFLQTAQLVDAKGKALASAAPAA
jgi:hypothetical protein